MMADLSPVSASLSWQPIVASLLASLMAMTSGVANAQTDGLRRTLDRTIESTVADRSSPPRYAFERLSLRSTDGQRHYRVYLGIPRSPASEGGYPVVYMLDGNAVMDTLRDEDLAALAQGTPPVLVAIGYEVSTRHDVVARAFDYTPPVLLADGRPDPDAGEWGRPGGGADLFLEVIEQQVKPAVMKRVSIDTDQQTLWGHSYGGLFALYTLLKHPASFQRYVIGDPSVHWYDGAVLQSATNFHAAQAPDVSVQILMAGADRNAGTQRSAAAASRATAVTTYREKTRQLVSRLAAEGMDITVASFPDQHHGQLFATSLYPALRIQLR